MSGIRFIVVTWLALGAVLALNRSASACPLCKETVSSDKNDDGPGGAGGAGVGGMGGEGGGGLPSGFNVSVYLLLGAFFVVLGGLIAGVVRAIKSTPVVMPPQNSPAFAVLPSGSSQGGTGSQRG